MNLEADICSEIAALWEDRPDELAGVVEQVRVIAGKLVEWGLGERPLSRDDIDHATIAYSKVVSSYECVQWLPFGYVPDWEHNLYCVLMDEERWEKYREVGRCTSKLAKRLRKMNPVLRERCPDCGALVPTIFEHVDGCPGEEN